MGQVGENGLIFNTTAPYDWARLSGEGYNSATNALAYAVSRSAPAPPDILGFE